MMGHTLRRKRGPYYMGFVQNASQKEARAKFLAKHGAKAREVVVRGGAMLVGPLPGKCFVCGKKGPAGEDCKRRGCDGVYFRIKQPGEVS